MTVKELKELLENLPDSADVYYYSDNGCAEAIANDVDYDEDLDTVYLM